MAMNKYMHPRNIYKSPPNFKQLALDYPEFREFVKQDVSGKVSLDFKDLNALRALSCTLLKKDFGLNVEIPLNKLIPTVPLRLNYILWIEDMLHVSGRTGSMKGVDIGTGASCVYPLIAAKKNHWSMVATEVDNNSFEYAQSNVKRNSLEDLIKVVNVKEGVLLKEVVNEDEYDFCMCNPPFFSSEQELHPFFKSRKLSRPHPKNAFCASVVEVVSKGGEVEFIKKLINESKTLDKKVKIYSTMIGHKCNLPPLKNMLREINVVSFKESYFCQGNTTRWGLAWTFCENIDLRKVPDPLKQIAKNSKVKNPLVYSIPISDINEHPLSYFGVKLLKMFKDLQLVSEEVSRNKNVLRYFVTAFSNTWSHQRRKRREKLKQSSESCSDDVEENLKTVVNNNNEDSEPDSPGKRKHEDSFDGTLIKKLRISEGNCNETVFFKFMMAIRTEETNICIELNCLDNYNEREYLHQILQYIKNNLDIKNSKE